MQMSFHSFTDFLIHVYTLTISKSGHQKIKDLRLLQSDYLNFLIKNFLKIAIHKYGLSEIEIKSMSH